MCIRSAARCVLRVAGLLTLYRGRALASSTPSTSPTASARARPPLSAPPQPASCCPRTAPQSQPSILSRALPPHLTLSPTPSLPQPRPHSRPHALPPPLPPLLTHSLTHSLT